MKIAIGADHRGFKHKQHIIDAIENIDWVDVGAHDEERSDFPVFTKLVCEAILNRSVEYGVLLCGSGIGMSIAANRYKKIYAALVWNDTVAKTSKEHDHANILVLPADYLSPEQAVKMIKIWLAAEPLAGRYEERMDMVDRSD